MEPVDIDAFFTVSNDLINVFMPIVSIAAGTAIALAILSFVSKLLVSVFQHENELKETYNSLSGWLDERKRKAHDHLYLEHEPEELGTVWAETEDGEIVQLERKD